MVLTLSCFCICDVTMMMDAFLTPKYLQMIIQLTISKLYLFVKSVRNDLWMYYESSKSIAWFYVLRHWCRRSYVQKKCPIFFKIILLVKDATKSLFFCPRPFSTTFHYCTRKMIFKKNWAILLGKIAATSLLKTTAALSVT